MEENKQNKIEENCLVYDIETKTTGSPDPQTDRLKLFGCYSYKTKKQYILTKIDDIQKIINACYFPGKQMKENHQLVIYGWIILFMDIIEARS